VSQQRASPEVLIYNAAVLGNNNVPSKLSVDSFVADFKVNVAGALACAQAVLPAMKAQGRGTILLTGCGFALMPNAANTSLGAGKAALRNLCFNLAEELAPSGIHVATVTIRGLIGSNAFFAPEAIADAYWTLYRQSRDQWQTEMVYQQP
jgi:short-subunit dehydrogenase